MQSLALRTFVPLLLALLALIYVVWSGQENRLHIQRVHQEQIDAIEDLTQQLSQEHLWLESYLFDGEQASLEKTRKHRGMVLGELHAIDSLSHNAADEGLEAHAKVTVALGEVSREIARWHELAEILLGTRPDIDADVEHEFNALFSRILELDETIETGVREQLDAHMGIIARENILMIVLASLLVVLSIVYVQTSFRRQVEALRREQALRDRLKDTEEDFRSLFDLSPVALWLEDFSAVKAHVAELCAGGVKDLEDYCRSRPELLAECAAKVRVLDVNQEALRMHGATDKAQLLADLGKTFTDESLVVFGAEVRAFVAGKAGIVQQARVCRLDGTPVDVIVSAKIMPGHEERLDRVLVAVLDVSERVQVEQALRESERRLSEAQKLAGLGSWELDHVAGTLSWSDEVFSLFDMQSDEEAASYEAFLRLVHPEDREAVDQAYARHIEQGEPYDIEHRLLLADGRVRHVHESCETRCDAEGKPLVSLGTIQDVTGRVLAEQAKAEQMQKMEHVQRLESLGVLAGGIAHDFNNLLTAIMGHAALARSQNVSPDRVGESLHAIEQTSHRAAELCRQMLAYSGKGKFVVKPVDLSELIRDMMRLLHVTLGKSVMMREELADGLPAVAVDIAQLRQVVMNLVINANEAIGEKGGMVVIATGVMQADADYLSTVYVEESELEPGCYVFLEVTDNGCGMDQQTVKHLFEPFFTTKFAGRGLGMSAILGIVRGHKGAIKVYTEPGKGTTIKVLLPAVDEVAVSLGESQPHDRHAHAGGGTVLVVDDESSIRNVAAMVLETAGYKVLKAEDGVEGVAMLREHRDEIDFVLLDMTMPRMGGEEAFTEMRRIKPDIRVILSSGYNHQTATQRFTGKGLAGFVQKPYTPDILLDALAAISKTAD